MLEDDVIKAAAEEEPLIQKNYEGETLCLEMPVKVEFNHVCFKKCRFVSCDFSGSMFYNVKFVNCDFSNCRFQSCYLKETEISGCKGDGGDFSQSTFRKTIVEEGCYHYANFESTLWDGCRLKGVDFSEHFLRKSNLKKSGLKK